MDAAMERIAVFVVYRKPLARRVVQKKATAGDVENKTPFVVK